jgi:hypothetical protein
LLALLLVLTRLVALAMAALLLVRLLGLDRGTLLALLIGALPLTLLPSYAVLAVAAVLRRRRLAAAGCGLVIGHLLVLAPAVGAQTPPEAAGAGPRLRVLTANLYVLNPDPEAAGRALRALRPDVLVVPELSPDGLAGLRASGPAGGPAALGRRARQPGRDGRAVQPAPAGRRLHPPGRRARAAARHGVRGRRRRAAAHRAPAAPAVGPRAGLAGVAG